MKKQLIEVACRRRKLLREIEAQRLEVAEISRQWHKPIALIDVGLKVVRFIRDHPALSSSAVAAFMAVRRKGISGLFQKREFLYHLVPFFGRRFPK
jgi:hypothetical protein